MGSRSPPPEKAPPAFRDEDFQAIGDSRVPLDRFLRQRHPGASWKGVRRLIETGKVLVDGAITTSTDALVAPGSMVSVRMAARRPLAPLLLDEGAIAYVDAHVIVVRKPAGIATVPYEDERDTLDRLVQGLLRRHAPRGTSVAPLGVVQRLDRETSGLIVFARTATAKRGLQQQLRMHAMARRYLAIAHGVLSDRTITSRLVQDRGDGLRGSTDKPRLGRVATTHVRVLERLDGATLVECRLETGRTHQIRIHLSEAGHPLLGERVYVRRFDGPVLPAPRLMLHAAELGFLHPVTARPLHFEEPRPDDFVGILDTLRK